MKSIPLFFLLILIFTLSLSAQRKSAKTRTSNQAANQVSINKEKEFDLSAERLPAGYRGNNFMQLISDISELKKLQEQKKDEYETLAQYQARMQKLENWRFSSGLTRDSLFGFVLHKDNFEPSYNADSQQLSATLSPQNFPDCTPSEEVWWRCKYFSLVSKGEDLGTYSASNVYGATRTVRVYHSLIVRLELFEEQPLSWSDVAFFSVFLKVPPDRARLVKPNLRVVAIGNLVKHDPLATSFHQEKPTFNSPNDSRWEIIHLKFKLKSLWYFNQATGEIYAKLPARH